MLLGNVLTGSHTVLEDLTDAPSWILTGITCQDSVVGGTASTGSFESRTATINLDPGETVTCTFTNLPASLVTSSSLCLFDVSDLPGNQFRMSYFYDPLNAGKFLLNSSNPGQFYYNAFYSGAEEFEVTMTIPFPFVTQGAQPIHVYSNFTFDQGTGCIIPDLASDITSQCTITTSGGSLSPSGAAIIMLDDHGTPEPEAMTSEATATLSCESMPLDKPIYMNMHLDYGLKKTSVWSKLIEPDGGEAASGLLLVTGPDDDPNTTEQPHHRPAAVDHILAGEWLRTHADGREH
jgi:hypothetical protein